MLYSRVMTHTAMHARFPHTFAHVLVLVPTFDDLSSSCTMMYSLPLVFSLSHQVLFILVFSSGCYLYLMEASFSHISTHLSSVPSISIVMHNILWLCLRMMHISKIKVKFKWFLLTGKWPNTCRITGQQIHSFKEKRTIKASRSQFQKRQITWWE